MAEGGHRYHGVLTAWPACQPSESAFFRKARCLGGGAIRGVRRLVAGQRRSVVPGADLGLEQLCRYVARPALAVGRLRIIDADQLSFALKTPWSDGTTHLVLSPLELLEKLAALVPHHGVT